jgi:hypothetical protein
MTFKNMMRERGLDLSGSGQRPVAGSSKHGNELLGSIKRGEFLDYRSNYQLLKKNFAL